VDRRGPLSSIRLTGGAGITQEEPVGQGTEEVEAEEAAPAAAGAATATAAAAEAVAAAVAAAAPAAVEPAAAVPAVPDPAEAEPTTGGVGTVTHAAFTKAVAGPGEPPLWKRSE
jgi:hypothetical protein